MRKSEMYREITNINKLKNDLTPRALPVENDSHQRKKKKWFIQFSVIVSLWYNSSEFI